MQTDATGIPAWMLILFVAVVVVQVMAFIRRRR
jgi:hypothetical protein